jgi:hypothetical protein
MTTAADLLKRLTEGDFTNEPPMAKNGWRVGSTDHVNWYLCDDCLKRRVVNYRLRTNRGYERVAEVMPVDDSSHNCIFCKSMLSPQAAAPAPVPMPPSDASASTEGGEAPPSNESLGDKMHSFKCKNTACVKYNLENKKTGNRPTIGLKCTTCGQPMSWLGVKQDTTPMGTPQQAKRKFNV